MASQVTGLKAAVMRGRGFGIGIWGDASSPGTQPEDTEVKDVFLGGGRGGTLTAPLAACIWGAGAPDKAAVHPEAPGHCH